MEYQKSPMHYILWIFLMKILFSDFKEKGEYMAELYNMAEVPERLILVGVATA